MNTTTRRTFLTTLAAATAGVLLLPLLPGCGGEPTEPEPTEPEPAEPEAAVDPLAVPMSKPADWDAVAFNTARGNAGAIPESYWPSINGEDGVASHLGKHLPYVPELAEGKVPAGFVALMWGDPAKGHAKHPNAAPTEENPAGHWYNWIKIRKATADEALEAESTYSSWPATAEGDTGQYAAQGDGAVADDGGKNTVYLAALPADVKPGDTVRIWAHCLTHGEYVEFLTVPG